MKWYNLVYRLNREGHIVSVLIDRPRPTPESWSSKILIEAIERWLGESTEEPSRGPRRNLWVNGE